MPPSQPPPLRLCGTFEQNRHPVPFELGGLLTASTFQHLATVPAELEWFAKLGNDETKRAYDDGLMIEGIGDACSPQCMNADRKLTIWLLGRKNLTY